MSAPYHSPELELEYLRLTMDTLSAGVSHVDFDGNILWANQYYCDLFGYSFEEIKKLNLRDISPPSDQVHQFEAIKQMLAGTRQEFSYDRQCLRKDGSFVWASMQVRLVRDSEGKPRFFLACLQDISARKQVELSLQESQSRLELAKGLARLALWEREVGTENLRWSEELFHIVGIPVGSRPLAFREFLEVVHPDDRAYLKAKVKELDQTLTEHQYSYRIIRPTDGAVRTLRLASRRVLDENGKSSRVIGTLQDVTEWVEQVAARKQSEKLLELVLDTIPAGIAYIGRDFRYQFVNHHYERRFKLAKEEVVGKTIEGLLGTERFHEIKARCEQALSGQFVEFEMRFRHVDGVTRDLHITYSPDKDSEHHVRGFVTLIQDVTEIRESERLILDQRQRMISSAKLAALGEMAGGISHEINNPLSVIHARAEALKEMALRGKIDAPKVAHYAEKIEITARRIAKIVKALRNIARDGEKDPFVKTSARSIVEDSVEVCRERFHNREIQFQVAEIPDGLFLNCRAVQISQVLLNLLGNAFDAVKSLPTERWVRIDVKDLGSWIEFSVTDSGSGIAVENREKIFQPFFTTKDVGEGTGLGLSVSKAIIDDHRGTIGVDPKSQNTRFAVTLLKNL